MCSGVILFNPVTLLCSGVILFNPVTARVKKNNVPLEFKLDVNIQGCLVDDKIIVFVSSLSPNILVLQIVSLLFEDGIKVYRWLLLEVAVDWCQIPEVNLWGSIFSSFNVEEI